MLESGNWKRRDKWRHTSGEADWLRVFWGLDGGVQMLVPDM